MIPGEFSFNFLNVFYPPPAQAIIPQDPPGMQANLLRLQEQQDRLLQAPLLPIDSLQPPFSQPEPVIQPVSFGNAPLNHSKMPNFENFATEDRLRYGRCIPITHKLLITTEDVPGNSIYLNAGKAELVFEGTPQLTALITRDSEAALKISKTYRIFRLAEGHFNPTPLRIAFNSFEFQGLAVKELYADLDDAIVINQKEEEKGLPPNQDEASTLRRQRAINAASILQRLESFNPPRQPPELQAALEDGEQLVEVQPKNSLSLFCFTPLGDKERGMYIKIAAGNSEGVFSRVYSISPNPYGNARYRASRDKRQKLFKEIAEGLALTYFDQKRSAQEKMRIVAPPPEEIKEDPAAIANYRRQKRLLEQEVRFNTSEGVYLLNPID